MICLICGVLKRAICDLVFFLLLLIASAPERLSAQITDTTVDSDAGTHSFPEGIERQDSGSDMGIDVPSFYLPESYYLSPQSRTLVRSDAFASISAAFHSCSKVESASRLELPRVRECQARAFVETPISRRINEKYQVAITEKRIGGIATEVFTPFAGTPERNRRRVLINLHGGAFLFGWQTLSRVESIPIAAVARIEVISVNYRHAPEAIFPAGSKDVVAVYRALLRTHKPGEIGIYGCSAGGILTAQAVAMLLKENLPVPGAIGMFCGAGGNFSQGDSVAFAQAVYKRPPDFLELPYFRNADYTDPLLSPALSSRVIGRFPPSLLISSSRDHQLSSVLYTHSRLVASGVIADLHVWEGLGHAFFYDPDLPESEEVYHVISEFFNKHLSR